MFVSTSGEDRERLEGLPEPSEDASRLLGERPPLVEPEEKDEYLPEPQIAWVLTAEFPAGPKDRLEGLGGGMTYGRDAATGLWTYLAAQQAASIDGWKLEIAYVEDRPEPPEFFQQREAELRQQLAGLSPTSVSVSLAPEQAAERAAELFALKMACDDTAQILLTAPETGFSGLKLWDALTSLGLEWGDGDLFHWVGLDQEPLFSVATSTDPGYFFPEELPDMVVEDLEFSFSIPRSPDPPRVYQAMLAAARYCQKRLGGSLEEYEPERIPQIVKELRAAGFEPGRSATLQLF